MPEMETYASTVVQSGTKSSVRTKDGVTSAVKEEITNHVTVKGQQEEMKDKDK